MSRESSIPYPGPYVFGLEHVPLPAVACDPIGNILWANDHFTESIGQDVARLNKHLSEIVELDDGETSWPTLESVASEGALPLKVRFATHNYTMHVGPVGELFGCVFAPRGRPDRPSFIGTKDGEDVRPSKLPPTGAKLLGAFIFLSRELNLTMREEELIQIFVKNYEDLFPGRLLCIQLVDPENVTLTQVYANGRLKEHMRNRVHLSREACEEHGLLEEDRQKFFEDDKVRITDEHELIFTDGKMGFDLPLFDGSSLFGVLHFEYLQADWPMNIDRPLVIPLAHQMSAALRNARLMSATVQLKDYLAKLLDRANAPVVVIDRDRRINVVNQAFERQTGHDRSNIVGSDIMSLIPDTEQAMLLPVVINAMRGESTSNIEMRIPRLQRDGVAHIAFNTASLMSSFGEVEGVIFVGQDLTEIRALQNQVIHSEKLATLGQVAAGVAHELNNPLTSIMVYGSYLAKKLEGQIDETDSNRLKRIVEAAGRIQSFSRDLVTYARPSGEEPVLIDIPELLDRALSFCEHLISEAGVEINQAIDQNLNKVYGIRGQLEQVFVNLLTNACNASVDTGSAIDLQAMPFDEERIQIVIRDSGCGIPDEHLDKVFEPFFTTKPEGQGTGLGLSIVRNILVNHNAEIEVESELGEGTTFRITMYTG